MPIIVFASPKGGAGKTTAAVILASEIARKGARVAIIDGDPRQRITRWSQKGSCPENFMIASDITEETIIDEIERCGQSAPFVIVDLEGTASLTVGGFRNEVQRAKRSGSGHPCQALPAAPGAG